MTRVVLLDTLAHRDIAIAPPPLVAPDEARHLERVVVSEFSAAAVEYPILFAKDSETGAFFAAAILGFAPGENLFLRDGRQSSYRPLGLRREPFFISGDDLAIDIEHHRVGEQGEPLFDETGAPSDYLRNIQGILTRLKTGVEATNAFIKTLLSLNLIEPIDIALSFDDGERCRLDGLYTISSDALHELPDDEILALFRAGYLELAHCLIGSLQQIPVLARVRNERLLESA